MYNEYKVIAHSAAGRRRYMQWLVPFVLAEPMVDRYDIWVNTTNMADIEFFKGLAEKFPKVNLVWQPEGKIRGNWSINAFYKTCQDEDAIYVRLDDDVVWMERDTIAKMVKFRVEHPDYFLVMPLVINNSLCTYLLQQTGKIHLNKYRPAACMDPVLWRSGKFAASLHQWFIDNYLRKDKVQDLHIGGPYPVAMARFSINCIVFWGKDMKAINGIVLDEEEEYVSCCYPASVGKACAWNGDTIMAHFAFFTQREQLDNQGILQQYGDILSREWNNDETMKPIHQCIRNLLRDIDANEETIMLKECPYAPSSPERPTFVQRLKIFFIACAPYKFVTSCISKKTEKVQIL